MTNDPQKLADTIVHLAHQNAGLSMEVGILKAEIDILNETIDELREELDDVLFDGEDELPPSRTNPDDEEWGTTPPQPHTTVWDEDEWGDERDDCEECGRYLSPKEGVLCGDCLGHKPTTYMVDPPSGWKYGFPKVCRRALDAADLDLWLEANGYPRKEIEFWQDAPKFGHVPCQVWKV